MLMRLAARAVVLSALVGCGAKTGLLLPDVPSDVAEEGLDVADAADVLDAPGDGGLRARARARVLELCRAFPLYR